MLNRLFRSGVIQSDGQHLWWEFSRCENSARVQRAESGDKGLRRCTRHYASQREAFHHLTVT